MPFLSTIHFKISTWVQELQLLSSFAITQPHAAYSGFTNQHMVIYCIYYAYNVADFFQPLDEYVRHTFIPAVTGYSPPGDLDRDLLALPT